jgi:hypothetical protein
MQVDQYESDTLNEEIIEKTGNKMVRKNTKAKIS